MPYNNLILKSCGLAQTSLIAQKQVSTKPYRAEKRSREHFPAAQIAPAAVFSTP
jgi:hypothetical protein